MKLYGNLNNRLEEDKMFCSEITVGTGVTEYFYSDREAYEVVSVKDQKHVTVRKYDHKLIGGPYSNDWQLISNPDNPERDLERRGNVWYWTSTVTQADVNRMQEKGEEGQMMMFHLSCEGFDFDKIAEHGKQTKRHRAKVSFGRANYYYDHEF